MTKITSSGSFLLITVVVLSITVFTGGAAGYSMSPSGSQDVIEISERQIDSEYGSATISSLSSIGAGDSVAVAVGVGAEEMNPNLQIRDQDNSILKLRSNVTDGSVQTFESSVFVPAGQSDTTAGTYLISLWSEGELVAAHPVVVQGYDVSVSVPESVEKGSNTTVTADLSERDLPINSDVESVEIAIGDDDAEIQTEMTQSDSGSYSATIDTSELDTNSYRVYVGVRGDAETELGENELLAITEAPDLSVKDNDESDESVSNDDSSEDNSDDESDDTDETGSENTSSGGNTTNTTNMADEQNTSSGSNADDTSSDSSTSDDDQNTETDSGTIEPTDDETSDTDDSTGTSSNDSIPGFGITTVIIALIVVSLVNRAD